MSPVKFIVLGIMVGFLSACTDPPVKEFFCESTDAAGGVNFYKQQVVRLSDRQMCINWPADAPVCVKSNQPQTTPWQVNEATETKHQEILELRVTRESAILQIMQRQVALSAGAADERPASPLLRFEFKKRPEVLNVLTSGVDKDPRAFSCKSWVKQAWWSIY